MSKDSVKLRDLYKVALRALRRRGPCAGKANFMARILVIDDEPLIAMAVSDWLSDLGHVVVGPASDLPSALALLEEPIDAAILDVSLGKDDSTQVARRLVDKKIPFAVASGHEVNTLKEPFASGLALPKPFGFENLRQVVEQLLAR
jgi:CheY-like chemotaxis protein